MFTLPASLHVSGRVPPNPLTCWCAHRAGRHYGHAGECLAPGCLCARFARVPVRQFARDVRRFVRTCTHAAKLLPTVWRAVPLYVWPILALATVVKFAVPVDFGADETLFLVAFALIAWRRPGLLRGLYREAQAGRPAPCACPRHASPRPKSRVRRVAKVAGVVALAVTYALGVGLATGVVRVVAPQGHAQVIVGTDWTGYLNVSGQGVTYADGEW